MLNLDGGIMLLYMNVIIVSVSMLSAFRAAVMAAVSIQFDSRF